MIESNVSIKLQSFEVPSLVQEQCSHAPAPCAPAPRQAPPMPGEYLADWVAPSLSPRQFQLSEVPAETLEKMCEDFKKEVFKSV